MPPRCARRHRPELSGNRSNAMMADSFNLNNDDNRSPSLLDACLLIRGRHQVAGAKVSVMARDKKTSLTITDTPLSSGRYAIKGNQMPDTLILSMHVELPSSLGPAIVFHRWLPRAEQNLSAEIDSFGFSFGWRLDCLAHVKMR